MSVMEIHAAQGGADAEAFAADLGNAVAKHFGGTTSRAGRVIKVHAPHRL